MAKPYQQELLELSAIVAQQMRDIDQLKRTGGTATWLDRCAWAAMQGLLANPSGRYESKLLSCDPAELATEAYTVAQAMLAEKLRVEGAP